MRSTISEPVQDSSAAVVIGRPGNVAETLVLIPTAEDGHIFMSAVGPAEPHEFDTTPELDAGGRHEASPFQISEPDGHHHQAQGEHGCGKVLEVLGEPAVSAEPGKGVSATHLFSMTSKPSA